MRNSLPVLPICLVLAGCVVVENERSPRVSTGDLSMGALGVPEGAGHRRPPAELMRGAMHESRGRWADALTVYSTITDRDLSDETVVLAHARALHAEGRAEEATDMLERACEQNPPSERLFEATGRSLLAVQQPQAAVSYFRRARELSIEPRPMTYATAVALILAGQHADAVAELKHVPARQLPEYLRLAAGRAALVGGAPSFAVDVFTAHLSLRPDDGDVWIDLARAYMLMGTEEPAREAVRRALRLLPGHPEALVLLGHVQHLSGEHAAALRSYAEAVENGADPAPLAPLTGGTPPTQDAPAESSPPAGDSG